MKSKFDSGISLTSALLSLLMFGGRDALGQTTLFSETKAFASNWAISWNVSPGNYRLKVSGVYADGVRSGAPQFFLDAAYDFASTPIPYNKCPSSGSRWRFVDNCNIRPTPDSYTTSHVYFYDFVNIDGTVDIDFNDQILGDNSGALTFELLSLSSYTANVDINNLSWTKINTGNCLRVTPNADSSLLFLSRATDVLKSDDRGANWTSTNWTFPVVRDGYALSKGGAFSRFNGGMLALSRFENGWALSSDNGNNYTTSGPQGFGTACFSIHALDDGRFLASRGGFLRGIYKSSGMVNSTWSSKYSGFDPYDFSAYNSTVIFSSGFNNSQGNGIVLKSTDKGETWVATSFPKYISDVEVVLDSLFLINGVGEVRVSSVANVSNSVLRHNFNFNKDAFNFLTYSKEYSVFAMSSSNQGVFLSKDNGFNWIKYTIPGVSDYRDATIVKDRIFIATDLGLYVADLQRSNSICEIPGFNPLPDTLRVCEASATLDAGAGFQSYSWSNGAAVSSIKVTSSGLYKVTSTNLSGCTGVDSTFVSLVKAYIIQNDTTICKGTSIKLSLDSVFPGRLSSNANLAPNLNRGLVAYYPFNGNADDETLNRNNGAVFNVSLAPDRNSRPNSAYQFNSANKSRIVVSTLNKSMRNSFSYSFWVKPEKTCVIPIQGQGPNAASGLFDNPCVIHPIHGWNFGDEQNSAGTGVYVGTNGLYLEEHSAGWEAVPISHSANLNGWHLINIIYENKVPFLYIDGVFIKKGLPSVREIYASLGPDKYPFYNYTQSGIGTGYRPTVGAAQYFQGSIDDIAYYGRALQPFEVMQIYYNRPTIKWSTGDSTVDIVVTPSKSTTYYVTVTDGVTSCTDSVRVIVSDLPNFNPLPDTTRVCGTTAKLDAGNGFAGYSWSNGSTTQSISPTSSGTYKVTVKNSAGCNSTDSTFLSLSKADILQTDTAICRGSILQLKSNMTKTSGAMYVSGAAPPEGYAVVSNIANILPTVSSKTYECTFRIDDNVPTGKNAAIWAFGPEPLQNCKAFALKVSSSQCGSNRLWLWGHNCPEFCGPTIVPGTTYHAVTVVEGNNVKVYLNGILQMNVTMNLSGVVSDRFFIWYGWDAHVMNGLIDDVRIWNFPWTQADVTSAYASCFIPDRSRLISGWDFNQGALNAVVNIKTGLDDIDFKPKVSISSTGIGACSPMPSGNIQWSTGEISETIMVKPLVTTTYYLRSLDVARCTDSVTIRVASVDTSIAAQGPTSVCSTGGAVPLQAGSAATYQWLRNGLAIVGASSKTHQASESGDYRVALTNTEGCLDTSRSVQITLNPDPNVSFAVDDSVKCIPDRRFTFVNQTTIASGSMTYTWDFGDGTTSQSPSPTVQYKTAGTYRVTLRASSDLGCIRSTSRNLRVDSMPKAMRYDLVNALANRPFTLDARNIGIVWQWTPPTHLTGANTRRPIFQGDRDQQYLITIRNASGCATVDTLFVRAVKDYGIHVPGGFTPDNDGRNDRLYPIAVGIKEMRVFKVFNRWGEMIYDNRSASASTGWDGVFKGKPAPMETYAWIAEGVDLDGKVIRRSGNTILIR
jgi:gliding motility-associated-like protein